MARRRLVWIGVLAALVLTPVQAGAQARDAFVQALVDLVERANGRAGDEGPQLTADVERLAAALSAWDAGLRRVEAGLQAEIGGAPPKAASRMRATLGLAYLERGRLADALTQLDQAESLDAAFLEARLLRADALGAAGRTRDAASAAQAAWRAADDNAVVAYRLLRRLGPAADPAMAAPPLRTLEHAAASAGAPLAVTWLAGAARLVDDAAVSAPVFPLGAYAGVFDLVRQARYAEAVARARAVVAADPLVMDPGLGRADVREAARLLAAGRAAEAASRLAAVDPARGSAQIQRLLGLAQAAAGDPVKGLEALRAAVRLAPLDERAHLALADALVAGGDADGALASLGRTVRAMPRSGQALWMQARLLESRGRGADALAAYERAGRIRPFLGASHVFAAVGRLQHTRLALDAAADAYAARVDLAPADPAAHVDLAEVYRAQDRHDAALVEYLIAALLDPGNARTLTTIGQLYSAAGRDADAVAVWRRALAADARQLEARYALSRALLRLGRTEEAADELKRFQDVQAQALADERQKFLDNSRRLQDAVGTTTTEGAR